ncbi:hypothetical protein DPMN_062618 [Dreissena polymorpha]|uniref:Uncharacterized protein n=1 Tax=Dreissena polymorpha TaxID=45954 RepID=A0A9D4HIA6_DREPO|nr:hypothetical protein DPMN_062618 [Dreissena polymorpha]
MTSSRFHPYAAAPMRGLYGGGRGGLFRVSRSYNSGGPSSASATGPGKCFACGEFSHFGETVLTSREVKTPRPLRPVPGPSSSPKREQSGTLKDEYFYIYNKFTID